MDVNVMRWPAERLAVEDLRVKGEPRLLLIDTDEPAPEVFDCLEDWARLPISDADLDARRRVVAVRAGAHGTRPVVEDSGILRYRSGWVALSPVERDLASGLVDRYTTIVSRELLAERAWPDGVPSRNALDVHMLRLRRRVNSIGLEIRTIRARGYLLQPLAAPVEPTVARYVDVLATTLG